MKNNQIDISAIIVIMLSAIGAATGLFELASKRLRKIGLSVVDDSNGDGIIVVKNVGNFEIKMIKVVDADNKNGFRATIPILYGGEVYRIEKKWIKKDTINIRITWRGWLGIKGKIEKEVRL
jgi:hypothetical protein